MRKGRPMSVTSEHVGTLFQLEERCRGGDPDAQRDACIAAAAICAAPIDDWHEALQILRREQQQLVKAIKGPGWFDYEIWREIADQADRSLYAEIDYAIDSHWEG
jgi:hypothetical protein